MPYLNGQNLRDTPLIERKKKLEALLNRVRTHYSPIQRTRSAMVVTCSSKRNTTTWKGLLARKSTALIAANAMAIG